MQRARRLGTSIAILALVCAPIRGQVTGALSMGERAEIERMRRRGEAGAAIDLLDEVLRETPGDPWGLGARSRARLERGDLAGAREDARAALEAGRTKSGAELSASELALIARTFAEVELEHGAASAALGVLRSIEGALKPDEDPRDAWSMGQVLARCGTREEARRVFEAGGAARGERSWERLLDQARCQRALGRVREAAETLVAADELARKAEGTEPDVLVELAELYFEVYGEVDDPVAKSHSSAELYREALKIHPGHLGAQLGLFALHRENWRRTTRSPGEILEEALLARPSHPRLLVSKSSLALDLGDLPTARAALLQAEEIAPGRRDVRIERAALLCIERRDAEAQALLAELASEAPLDARAEREVGRHLLELYRFAEGLPFLARAVERDPADWEAWKELGRAQANTGDEDAARATLERAVQAAEGRRDAWRDNTRMVLERMRTTLTEEKRQSHVYAWRPDAAFVYESYLVPFYEEARELLSARYGFTPGPVKIEFFRRWADFSVRSTGFEGFPALGVCFGPVVTAVEPLAEIRGQFSWARTAWHEFTHVLHLGLSSNRCPRWITEGLATWEESQRDPAWKRNLRRELVDWRANDRLIPVRQLNGAFRGEHVVFAYYQSGLVCRRLIAEHGFASMVRLLEAFDRGLDLDQAFAEVFQQTPEEVDQLLRSEVERELAGIAIEPRWAPSVARRLRLTLPRAPSAEAGLRERYAQDWCTVAWASYWDEKRVDAEEALRRAEVAGRLPARGLFLKAELALAGGDRDGARALFREGFDSGGEEFRARMALGKLFEQAGELGEAEAQYHAAERDFPGYDDADLSAELALASLFETLSKRDEAMEARRRWLAFNADDYDNHLAVARWLVEKGRVEDALHEFRRANEVDPFRRLLHADTAEALAVLARHAEVLRECDVGIAMTAELDLDCQPIAASTRGDAAALALAQRLQAERRSLWDAALPRLHARRARALLCLARGEEARAAAEAALGLDAECAEARAILQELDR